MDKHEGFDTDGPSCARPLIILVNYSSPNEILKSVSVRFPFIKSLISILSKIGIKFPPLKSKNNPPRNLSWKELASDIALLQLYGVFKLQQHWYAPCEIKNGEKRGNNADDSCMSYLIYIYYIVMIYINSQSLELPQHVTKSSITFFFSVLFLIIPLFALY